MNISKVYQIGLYTTINKYNKLYPITFNNYTKLYYNYNKIDTYFEPIWWDWIMWHF